MKTKIAAAMAVAALLAGCGAPTTTTTTAHTGTPDDPNEMNLTGLPGGSFSGNAGGNWTADEVKGQIGKALCAGKSPASFTATAAGDGLTFKGAC